MINKFINWIFKTEISKPEYTSTVETTYHYEECIPEFTPYQDDNYTGFDADSTCGRR